MLNKYIEFLKRLSESVFQIKSVGNFSDYFEAVWRGFLLLFLVIISIAGTVAIVAAPFVIWSKVWARLTKKIKEEIKQLFDEGKAENVAKMQALQNKLTKIKVIYVCLLSLLHLPFVVPLVIMMLDFVF